MKVGIIGATAGVGSEVTKQAVAAGHTVKIMSRSQASADKAFAKDELEKIEVLLGDAMNKSSVEKLVKDCEVVIVSLGARPECPKICSEAQVLINAAVEANPSCKRLVVVSSIGVNESYDDLGYLMRLATYMMIRAVIADKCIQEDSVRNHKFNKGQNWSIIRPALLGTGPATKKYKVQEKGIGGGFVPRADIAHFILDKCLKGQEYANKAVTVVSA